MQMLLLRLVLTDECHPLVLPDHAHAGADDPVRLLPHDYRVACSRDICRQFLKLKIMYMIQHLRVFTVKETQAAFTPFSLWLKYTYALKTCQTARK